MNGQLLNNYPQLFSHVDVWIMLKAPSFDCVYDWRLQQEDMLRIALQNKGITESTAVMSESDIARFIQRYQRITEHTLTTLPDKVHYLYELDERREVVALTTPVTLY